MKTMGVRELKAHMSEVLDQVSAGETVGVTRNRRTIAWIVPANEGSVSDAARHATVTSLGELAARIGERVTERTNVAESLGEMRR